MNAKIAVALSIVLGMTLPVQAQSPAPSPAVSATPVAYLTPAPFDRYRIVDSKSEIALARTAAPPSISDDAGVMVLGAHGYEVASKGTNGFVCFVERAWTATFNDPEFWNPKSRAPNCFNPAAARTVLPQYMERARWIAAGADLKGVIAKTRAAYASHRFTAPAAGSLTFMMSKDGYLSDAAGGPWVPHMMFFLPPGQAARWGAGLEGSPVIGSDATSIEPTVLLVPVRRWSDGSPAPSPAPLELHHRM